MKQTLFLLFFSVFMLPFFESQAQVQETHTPTHFQELTPRQKRQAMRDMRKKARELADKQAFDAAVKALKERNWVLMANTLYGPRGTAIPVSDNTNFIQFEENTVYVQLAFNGIAGPNGLGGITVKGTPSQVKNTVDKHGNVTYSFYVNGIALTAQIVVNLSGGCNYANATVYPMMHGNNLSFSGFLVPTSQAGIFRSGFTTF